MSDEMTAGTIRIKGYKGAEIEAYLARPADSPKAGVVVIHHMPGYDAETKEITRTFATHGYAAICPNLHYHQAPDTPADDAAAASRAAGGVPDEQLVGDVDGAMRALRETAGVNKIGVIGYCSGGRQAFLAACTLELNAAVDCYGAFVSGTPPKDYPVHVTPLLDKAPNLSCPLLGLFGAEDKTPSPEHVKELDDELNRLGKEHEFHTFENAGHAFFAVNRPSYRPEAAIDGWQLIWNFFARNLDA
jgi:carboxymethylenebutenolidase